MEVITKSNLENFTRKLLENDKSIVSPLTKKDVFYVPSDFDWSQDLSEYAWKTFAIKDDFNIKDKLIELPIGSTLDFSYGGRFILGEIKGYQGKNTNEVTNMVIPNGRKNVLDRTSLSGNFYSKDKIYLSYFLTEESHINYNYHLIYTQILETFIYAEIVYDLPFYPKTVRQEVTIGEGNYITTEGNGSVFSPFTMDTILSSNVTISNCEVNGLTGITFYVKGSKSKLENSNFTNIEIRINSDNNIIKDCNFTSTVGGDGKFHCVELINAKHNTIKNNNFKFNNELMYRCRAISLLQGSSYNIIENNEIDGGVTGIILYPNATTGNGTIKCNTIKGNTFYNISEEAISMDSLMGSDKSSKNVFTPTEYVSETKIKGTFTYDDGAEDLYGYMLFGLTDNNFSKYSEIASINISDEQSKTYEITVNNKIFDTSCVGESFGVCFGFTGNVVSNNIAYKGNINIYGCGFNNIITGNISYMDSYMAIYNIGGSKDYVYGKAVNCPMIGNIISNNIIPYGGILVAKKNTTEGATTSTNDTGFTKYSNIYTKVFGNTCGMYVDVYGFYFSDVEHSGTRRFLEKKVMSEASKESTTHDIKFATHKDFENKDDAITNTGNRVIFLDENNDLYIYNGDKDASTGNPTWIKINQ